MSTFDNPYEPRHPAGGHQVRAKDVTVTKLFKAFCEIKGCRWSGELQGSYQEANRDRQAHLDWHRYQEMGVAP